MEKISVIVPVYKAEKYIHRCIDSILAQTYSNIELILVNDGSPDNSGVICDEYAAQDYRVHVIHQDNSGVSAARNAGIDWAFANSDSAWLAFVDSDDYIHPDYLLHLYNSCDNMGLSISVCNATRENFDIKPGDLIPQQYTPEYIYCDNHLRRNIIVPWGKLFRKSLWDGIRFPVGKIHEDRFTIHKILFQVPTLIYLEAELYFNTINPDSITHTTWSLKRLDDFEALEEQYIFFRDHQFQNALQRTALSALHMVPELITKIRLLPLSPQEQSFHIRRLRSRLRYYMKQHKKDLNININRFCLEYETAYPVLMKLYWYGRAVLRKLRLVK